MSKNQYLALFTITHQSERRIKIIVPSLFCDKERAIILQTILMMREAIEEVNIGISENAVSINYDPVKLPEANLLYLLEIVLKNFSQKPQTDLKKNETKHVKKSDVEHVIAFKIKGMSCNSCALFLEMVLSRNPDIVHSNINYISETGVVQGYLNQEEIIKIIEKNGYQVCSVDIVA